MWGSVGRDIERCFGVWGRCKKVLGEVCWGFPCFYHTSPHVFSPPTPKHFSHLPQHVFTAHTSYLPLHPNILYHTIFNTSPHISLLPPPHSNTLSHTSTHTFPYPPKPLLPPPPHPKTLFQRFPTSPLTPQHTFSHLTQHVPTSSTPFP